jgi:Tol biopolymer transport system component
MKKGIMMKKFVWIAALVAVSFVFWGCDWFSSDDDKSSKFKDYSTGVVEKLGAVPADGTKTLQAGTADTHEVETDGNWIVWKGRSINLGYFDGTAVTDLDTGLEASVTPWAFNYCDDSPIGFDGTTIVAVANDVASADLPEFYYYVPEDGTGGAIDLPFEGAKDLQYDYDVYVSGDLAVVGYGGMEAYRANLSDDTPVFTEFTLDNEPAGIVGVYAAAINYDDGCVEGYDLTDETITAVPLTGDGDDTTDPFDFQTANGIFTWVEGSGADQNAYYSIPGAGDSAEIYSSDNAQTHPGAGPDYFLWNEDGSLWYMAAGGDTPEEVGYNHSGPMALGDGFFAYVADDDDGNSQIFVYDLSNLTATEGVQVTENGEGAEEESEAPGLYVDGTKIYDVFNYQDVCNPSKVLVMYDVATEELLELTGDRDFQQTPVYVAAGGKAVFLHRDHSFRLFVKKAASTAKPKTITPPDMMVNGRFDVTDGVVAFHALDRSRYIDNPGLAQDFEGEDLIEIYYIDLDGARKIKQITNNGSKDYHPMTDGAFVTWYDYEDLAWAYKIATGESKVIGPGGYRVDVDGGIAVWREDSSYDLYYCDLNDWDNLVAVQVEGATSLDNCPEIANGLITWEDNNHPYYYNLNADSPEVVDIYADAPSEDYTVQYVYHPRTDGTYITWEEQRDAWDHDGEGAVDNIWVIVAYDTVNEELLTIPAADWDETYDTCYPRISDGVVVFAAEEYGVENPDGDKEIFYCDLTADTLELVRLTNDPNDDPLTVDVDESVGLWDSKPEVADGLIVWRTGGGYWNGNYYWRGKCAAAARLY